MIKIDKIVKSKRRTVGLELASDASLIIRAPRFASFGMIQKIVEEKQDWIYKKQAIARKKHAKTAPKKFLDGEAFLYLGNSYKLFIIDNIEQALVFEENFLLSRKHLENAKEKITDWYKKQAYSKISERVQRQASLAKLQYNKVAVTNAKKRWGSCSFKGNLNFAWRLIMAPLEVIDYVVVHEIVHLKEKNHSWRFWNEVEKMFPNYKQHRKWLKDNGHLMNL